MRYSFLTAAAKHLSQVEIVRLGSSQHELNGVSSLRRLFGDSRTTCQTEFVLYDFFGNSASSIGTVTWYDARVNTPGRTEYRLYYSSEGEEIVNQAEPGDLVVVGYKQTGDVSFIIAKRDTEYYDMFCNVFGLNEYSSEYALERDVRVG